MKHLMLCKKIEICPHIKTERNIHISFEKLDERVVTYLTWVNSDECESFTVGEKYNLVLSPGTKEAQKMCPERSSAETGNWDCHLPQGHKGNHENHRDQPAIIKKGSK